MFLSRYILYHRTFKARLLFSYRLPLPLICVIRKLTLRKIDELQCINIRNSVRPMKNLFGLTLILASFWMINSGYFKPFFLICGTVSVIITLYFVIRMTKQDGEQFPLIMPTLRLPGYLLTETGQRLRRVTEDSNYHSTFELQTLRKV